MPKIHVHDRSVDTGGVNVDNRRFVYVAMRTMGEYNMNMFINLEDYKSQKGQAFGLLVQKYRGLVRMLFVDLLRVLLGLYGLRRRGQRFCR